MWRKHWPVIVWTVIMIAGFLAIGLKNGWS